MFTLPDHLTAPLSAEVAGYIPTFVPQRLLTREQWARCREAVWMSCAATLPPSREDAKTQMSVTCAFLAFTDKVAGSVDLAAVLTEDLINRFLIDTEGTASPKTRQNRRGHLRRALKAVAGDTARVTHEPRRSGAAPYTSAELARLAAAAFSRASLAAALARGLSAGVVVPDAVGTQPPVQDAVRVTIDALQMDDRWIALVAPGEFSEEEWKLARKAADAVGVRLTAHRLRATWVRAQLSAPRPLAVTARALGLTRADLENVARHLPQVDPARAAELMRG